MNKQDVLKSIITDDSSCREYVSNYMVDEHIFDFKLMLRELQKDNSDYTAIGRLFGRAYNYSINNYVSIKK